MNDDLLSKLERLAKLKEQGVLTDAEFEVQKAALLQDQKNGVYTPTSPVVPVKRSLLQSPSFPEAPVYDVVANPKGANAFGIAGIVVGAFVILVLVLTNPSLEDHQAKVKALFMEKATSELVKESDKENGLAALGAMLGATFAESLINNMVSRDNYLLFSITKVSFDNESKVIGFGILGNVFIMKKVEDLKK
ncbi:DUF4359 domain-containing protein [Spirosoma telluris]|uniref:DUF4359 domain-containing protein n=1 Tax=Spirosoma telluris TaxID=2183553 RepID=UPI0018DBE128